MRTDGRESDNIEDRRGQPMRRGPVGARGLSIGGVVIALLASYFLGIDPSLLMGVMQGGGPGPQSATVDTAPSKPRDTAGRFVSVVVADTEDTWGELFRRAGRTYEPPRLVLFTGATPTACGLGESAAGPFYCPADRKVYIDLAFYDLLQQRFRAPGDFAQAYVIAHEVGHHVQNILGIMDRVDRLRRGAGTAQANALSVRVELQADCFAGLWAHHAQRTRQILEAGDVEEALRAATAIGDDTLQRATQGRVVPDTFTHGSAQQRVRWFRIGLESGDLAACDTFQARQL